jgi:hypothetical protein
MANISNASGTIVFPKTVPEKLLNEWAESIMKRKAEIEMDRAREYFGIEEFWSGLLPGVPVRFYGSGRWSFRSTIEDGCLFGTGVPTEEGVALMEWLAAYGKKVYITYCDEEAGNGVLYREKDAVTCHPGNNGPEYEVGIISQKDFEYASRNLVKVCHYDGLLVSRKTNMDLIYKRFLKCYPDTEVTRQGLKEYIKQSDRHDGWLTEDESFDYIEEDDVLSFMEETR